MSILCPETGLSVSYAYKLGCRCAACKKNKQKYTFAERNKAKIRAKEWWEAHRYEARELRKKYNDKNILKKYLQLKEKYGPNCMICGQNCSPDIGNGTKLHLDHCHKTGKIRGLLCGSCNVGLGHFKDNTDLLSRAISYLKENGEVYPV